MLSPAEPGRQLSASMEFGRRTCQPRPRQSTQFSEVVPEAGKVDLTETTETSQTRLAHEPGKKRGNKVQCHTDLERQFADFLDSATDVVRYKAREHGCKLAWIQTKSMADCSFLDLSDGGQRKLIDLPQNPENMTAGAVFRSHTTPSPAMPPELSQTKR